MSGKPKVGDTVTAIKHDLPQEAKVVNIMGYAPGEQADDCYLYEVEFVDEPGSRYLRWVDAIKPTKEEK